MLLQGKPTRKLLLSKIRFFDWKTNFKIIEVILGTLHLKQPWDSSVTSVKALSGGSCYSQVDYKRHVLNISKKVSRKTYWAKLSVSEKNFMTDIFLGIFPKFSESYFQKHL